MSWYKFFGALGWEYVSDIFINQKQDIFICGSVGGGTIIGNDTFIVPEFFAARYKISGDLDLLIHSNGDINNYPTEIGADSSGNIYLFGSEADSSDEYPEYYVAKINAQGISNWVQYFGTTNAYDKSNMTIVGNGNFSLLSNLN